MAELSLFPVPEPGHVDERPGWSGKTSVYLLYDQGGCLLYVGITSTGTKRFAQHRDSQPWFDEVASAAFEHYDTRYEAVGREAWLIRHRHPIHNKALNDWPGTHRCVDPSELFADDVDPLTLHHCCAWMESSRRRGLEERRSLVDALASPEAMCTECRIGELRVRNAMVEAERLSRSVGVGP